jgi:hypothetical protein
MEIFRNEGWQGGEGNGDPDLWIVA